MAYYYNKSRWTGHTYTARAAFTVYRKGWRFVLPLEPIFKVVVAIIGVLAEFIWCLKYDFGFPIGNAHHMTMFAFFGISGLVDLAAHYKKTSIPPNVDYAGLIIAFVIEALLFNSHLHERSPLDVTIHILLIYTIVSNAILLGVEVLLPHNILVSWTKALSVLVQGTWFWQIAFILYSPVRTSSPWHPDDPEHLLLAVMIFTWHIGINIALMTGAVVIVTVIQNRLCYNTDGYRTVDTKDSQYSRTMFLGKEEAETDESESA